MSRTNKMATLHGHMYTGIEGTKKIPSVCSANNLTRSHNQNQFLTMQIHSPVKKVFKLPANTCDQHKNNERTATFQLPGEPACIMKSTLSSHINKHYYVVQILYIKQSASYRIYNSKVPSASCQYINKTTKWRLVRLTGQHRLSLHSEQLLEEIQLLLLDAL